MNVLCTTVAVVEAAGAWFELPLHGTREFAQGIAEYAIAVALVVREGEAVFGAAQRPHPGYLGVETER